MTLKITNISKLNNDNQIPNLMVILKRYVIFEMTLASFLYTLLLRVACVHLLKMLLKKHLLFTYQFCKYFHQIVSPK